MDRPYFRRHLKLVRSIVSVLARRFRSRAVLQVKKPRPRRLHVLRRQRPSRPRLFTLGRIALSLALLLMAALSGHDDLG